VQIIVTTDQKLIIATGPHINTTTTLSRSIQGTVAWTNTRINKLITENILEVDLEKKLSNKRNKPIKLTEKGIKIRELLLELEKVTNG